MRIELMIILETAKTFGVAVPPNVIISQTK